MIKYLKERGITLNDFVTTSLELFVSPIQSGTKKNAVELLKEGFIEALSDVDVSCHVEVTRFLLDENSIMGWCLD